MSLEAITKALAGMEAADLYNRADHLPAVVAALRVALYALVDVDITYNDTRSHDALNSIASILEGKGPQ